jgi:hypothetical protein
MKTLVKLLVGIAIALCGVAHAQHNDEEWREAKDFDMAGARLAVLKAAGAVYLSPGDSAFLFLKSDGSASLEVGACEGVALAIVTYDGEKAILQRDGLSFDLSQFFAEAGRYPISTRLDLSGGLQEVAPGEMAMRLILFDQGREDADQFDGLFWYDYDPAFRITARFKPAADFEAKDIQTERGLWKRFYQVGMTSVKLGEKEVEFPLYSSTDNPEDIVYFFTSFTDETTGDETYGVGRYIEADNFGAFPPKKITLDFNRAYNPYCARSPHYNCPVAMTHLPVELKVGERMPKGY